MYSKVSSEEVVNAKKEDDYKKGKSNIHCYTFKFRGSCEMMSFKKIYILCVKKNTICN